MYSKILQQHCTSKYRTQEEVFDELEHKTSKYSHPSQKYVTLMFDEMSVKDDLVYDKVTGQMVGFVDVGKNMEAFMKQGYKAGNLDDQVYSPCPCSNGLQVNITC